MIRDETSSRGTTGTASEHRWLLVFKIITRYFIEIELTLCCIGSISHYVTAQAIKHLVFTSTTELFQFIPFWMLSVPSEQTSQGTKQRGPSWKFLNTVNTLSLALPQNSGTHFQKTPDFLSQLLPVDQHSRLAVYSNLALTGVFVCVCDEQVIPISLIQRVCSNCVL